MEIVKIGLEDICGAFNIKEDLLKKYFIEEILKNQDLLDVIKIRNEIEDWRIATPLGGPGTVLNGIIAYCLIRHYDLEFVLETGVAAGFCTCFLLAAVQKNNKGKLYSVELSDDEKEVGKLVKNKERWSLSMGQDSIGYLKSSSELIEKTALFCHDSLHTMSHMLQELLEFKKCEKDRFLIYIDDQISDNFWTKCLRMKSFEKPGYEVSFISGAESRLEGHLGGYIKYEKIDTGKTK